MPRTAAQNQVIKDKRRTKFLESALRVAYYKAYEEIVIDDITKDAGSSHGLFYHYFKTKDECYAAAIEEIVLPSPYAVPLAKAKELGGAKGLTLFADYFSKVHAFTPRQFRIAQFSVCTTISEEFRTALPELAKQLAIAPVVTDLIVQAQAEGKGVEGNPEEIARFVDYAILGAMGKLHYIGRPKNGISKSSLLKIVLK